MPKTATAFVFISFSYCEQWFKFLFLLPILFSFALPTAAETKTTAQRMYHYQKAPNANGKWLQVATAHQIQPFISIQIYKQMLNTKTHTMAEGSEQQANKAGKERRSRRDPVSQRDEMCMCARVHTHTPTPSTFSREQICVKIKSNPTRTTNPNANGMENILHSTMIHTHTLCCLRYMYLRCEMKCYCKLLFRCFYVAHREHKYTQRAGEEQWKRCILSTSDA